MIITIDNAPSGGTCQSAWGLNNCPNRAAFIAVNIGNEGFGVMCETHKEAFTLTHSTLGVRFEPYTAEREIELAMKLAALPPTA